ncbi:leucine-rich repeat protein, putative [Bodo saltans]|uniref:Leucine-rich repeat protein, putative n=1 Tax=Bodo saltans TaxID=75058 RepID=A0A0S4JRX1_BODSA|nr:leucine-rich repeat protein, putative [Bodo saltans]|eukprot:CUG93010.1 leucine-rich repeat protein, putative [Bodo saltans]
MEVEELPPLGGGALLIIVRELHAKQKAYPYQLRLCVDLSGGRNRTTGNGRSKLLPMSLWNPPTTTSSSFTQPPSHWDEMSQSVRMPHAGEELRWVLEEGVNGEYIRDDASTMKDGGNQRRNDVRIAFQLQKLKELSVEQHQRRMYPATVVLPASRQELVATLHFGEAASVVVVVRRVGAADVQERTGPSTSYLTSTTTVGLPNSITSLSEAAEAMHLAMAAEQEGSRAHKLLSEWGDALKGVGEQLAPLVEALPFGAVLVKAATKLFAAVAGRGAVMELGAEVSGQSALVLRVLARPSVQRLITSHASTHTLIEKLAGIMDDVVRILDEYRRCGSVGQLWSATQRLRALEDKSTEIRETFTLLHQLTMFHAQAAQCDDVHVISERLSAMHATKVLTAEDLTGYLLPQLITLIDDVQDHGEQAAAGASQIADVVKQMDEGLRRDLNELVGNLFKDMALSTSIAVDESVGHVAAMITETVETVIASSNGASIAALSATMRCVLDEAMITVLPQAVGNVVDNAFHTNLAVLKKSLDDAVSDVWVSSLQRELQDATKQVQAHTAQTIDASQQQLVEQLDGALKERLGVVLVSARNAIDKLDDSMRQALDAQTNKLFTIVREEVGVVRSAVAAAQLSSQDRIAVLHLRMTEVTSELHIHRRILETMHAKLNTMYNDAGVLRDGQVELTTVLQAIPDELRKALAPDMQELYQQLRFHESRSKKFVVGLLEKAMRKAVASYASLESMQAQQHTIMKRLEAQQDLLTAQRTLGHQQLEVSHTILAEVLMLREQVAAPSQNMFVYSAANDDVSLLTPEHRDYFQQIPLSMLQREVRCLYFDLYARERSTVATQIELNRMALYTSLRIVHSVALAHREDASDSHASYEGSSMESTEVLSIMDERGCRSLLVEGRAGIGKTTWAIHLAQLQNYSSGIVVFVRLSDVASYLEKKTGSSDSSTLSPRELILISFKVDMSRTDLIDRLFFHARSNANSCKIVWLIDGLDEVIWNPNAHLKVVLDAIKSSMKPASSHLSQLFGAHDLVVVTSREERGGALSNAEFVATVNPWTLREAIEYIRNFFSQQEVRDVVPKTVGSPEDCVRRAVSTIETQRFGSFSTLPIVLEMLCWHYAKSAHRIDCISDLYRRTVLMKIAATRSVTPDCTPTTDDMMVTYCKDISRTAVGVFFTIDGVSDLGSRLLRSGLVRESFGVTDEKTVRFVHKSFLEYFQALYFSEHLEELGTAMHNCPAPLSTVANNIEFTTFPSRDDILRIVSPMDAVVDLELACCRELSGNIVVDWLAGSSELALYLSGKPTGQNNVSCKWDHEKEPTKMLRQIELHANLEYFFVLRLASVTSGIVPVRCTLRGSNTLSITQRLPVCDIPGHRQQRNFFQFLTDAVRLDARKKQRLFDYLVSRLQYHHLRVACSMESGNRSLTSPLLPNLAASAVGVSKAQLLSEGGLSIVTECAATLLADHSTYAASLGSVVESTSLFGRIFESVGIRRKAIFEWALLPVAQHGTSVMWRSIASRIPKSLLAKLKETVLGEALVMSLVNGRPDVATELRSLSVTIKPALACRLGATDVILAEIKAIASRHEPLELDTICQVALVESLRSAQYDTASAVWEELALITHATPLVWGIVLTPFTGSSALAGAASLPTALAWLHQRHRSLLQHIPSSLHVELELHAICTVPSRYLHELVSLDIVTLRGLLSVEHAHFLEQRNVDALLTNKMSQLMSFKSLELLPAMRSNVLVLRINQRIGVSHHLVADRNHALPRLFTKILDSCQYDLERLHIAGCTMVGVPQVSLHAFHQLHCDRCSFLTAEAVRFVLSALTLREVSIIGCHFSATAFDEFTRRLSSLALTSVRITDCKGVSDVFLRHIITFQLNALDLSGCTAITDDGLVTVAIFRCLKTLTLSSCTAITNSGLVSIASLTQLRHLDLRACDKITDSGLASIASLTELQHLDLHGCDKITDSGLASIASLTELQHLDLHGCNKITDSGLASIASLTELQHLDLHGCNKITDSGLASIALLTQLQHLDLHDCYKITDSGLASIALLTELRHLDLDGCDKITNSGLASIALLTQLQHLDLRFCYKITDSGLASIALLTQLQHLDLHDCDKITDSGLLRIALLTQLQHLHLDSCNKITDSGLASIASLRYRM